MASEALKLLLRLGEPLLGRLLIVDLLGASTSAIEIEREKSCPVCGDEPSITQLIDYEEFCAAAGS